MNPKKKELNDLLNSYNLDSRIQFPTRISNNSRTSIDNIFFDTTKFLNFTISAITNGLSDQDAQILEIYVNKLDSKKPITRLKL
jgi:hypothetical protein